MPYSPDDLAKLKSKLSDLEQRIQDYRAWMKQVSSVYDRPEWERALQIANSQGYRLPPDLQLEVSQIWEKFEELTK